MNQSGGPQNVESSDSAQKTVNDLDYLIGYCEQLKELKFYFAHIMNNESERLK